MSVQHELEALYVRLFIKAEDLAYSKVRAVVEDLASSIAGTLEDAAKIRPSFLMDKSSVAQLESVANKIKNVFDTANKAIAGSDSAAAASAQLSKLTQSVEQLSQVTGLLRRSQADIQETTVAVRNLAAAGYDLSLFASRFTTVMESLKTVGTGPNKNLAQLATDLIALNAAIEPLGKLGGQANQLQPFLKSIVTIANDPSLKISGFNVQGLSQFATAISRINSQLGNLSAASNLGRFVSSIKAAAQQLNSLGSMPSLLAMANNANRAVVAFIALNSQLTIYIRLMSQISGMSMRVPTPRNVPSGIGGGGGGAFAPGGVNAFGFDPIRRGLSMLTSLGTGLAVGFFGFEMIRQVTRFDDNMTRAMSVLHLSLQQNRVRLGQDLNQLFDHARLGRIRATVEDDILALSRRGTVTAEDLVEAFGQLSAKGYGTENLTEALRVVQQFATVGSMGAADSARELATIQAQLGLASNDSLQNAKNLRYIADTITQGAQLSGRSTETFLQDLVRLNPQVQFLNRGLEESVSLLAAFSRVTPSTALSHSQALLRSITSQFIRSVDPGGSIRTGAGIAMDPVGMRGRMFRPGDGVQPVHMMTESVRLAADAWRQEGISVFDANRQFIGVAATILEIDRATRHLSDQSRGELIGRLFPGQLRSTATDALKAILGNAQAMEALTLSARRADGILDQVANERLQSFNSQLAILKNNLIVVGIETGRVLVPVLREVNNIIIASLDAWWEMGGAGRAFLVSALGISLALVSLRFALPVVIGLFKVLFFDTLVTGFSMVSGLVGIVTWIYAAMAATYAWAASSAILAGIWVVIKGIWTVSMLMATGNIAGLLALKTVVWLVAIATQAYALASTYLGIVVAFLNANNATLIPSILMVAAAKLIAKAATWLLNAAMTALAAIMTYVLAVSGLIIISFILLAAVIAAAIVVANIAFVALLQVLQGIIIVVIGIVGAVAQMDGRHFADMWDGFIEATERAFWATVGFFNNFRHNMDVLMNWMDRNWANIIFNMTHFADVAFINMGENIKISMAKTMMAVLALVIATFRVIADLIANVANPLRMPAAVAAANAQAAQVGALAGGNFVPFDRGLQLRALTPLADATSRGGIFSRGSGWRLGVDEAERERIQNMFGRPRLGGEGGHAVEEAASRIGTTFHEISLKRFVLEGAPAQEDARREELIEAQRHTVLLELIAERLGVPALLGPAPPPVRE